jgi:hypothetical protein
MRGCVEEHDRQIPREVAKWHIACNSRYDDTKYFSGSKFVGASDLLILNGFLVGVRSGLGGRNMFG